MYSSRSNTLLTNLITQINYIDFISGSKLLIICIIFKLILRLLKVIYFYYLIIFIN